MASTVSMRTPLPQAAPLLKNVFPVGSSKPKVASGSSVQCRPSGEVHTRVGPAGVSVPVSGVSDPMAMSPPLHRTISAGSGRGAARAVTVMSVQSRGIGDPLGAAAAVVEADGPMLGMEVAVCPALGEPVAPDAPGADVQPSATAATTGTTMPITDRLRSSTPLSL